MLLDIDVWIENRNERRKEDAQYYDKGDMGNIALSALLKYMIAKINLDEATAQLAA